MEPDTVLEAERIFERSRNVLFRALTEPKALAQWFAPDGWRAVPESVELNPRPDGRLRHMKVRGDDPVRTWAIDGIYTEVFCLGVLMSQQRITGIEGIDPSKPVELRVEFSRRGQGKTLLRVAQGPYEPQAAVDYAKVQESILDRLQAYTDGAGAASWNGIP